MELTKRRKPKTDNSPNTPYTHKDENQKLIYMDNIGLKEADSFNLAESSKNQKDKNYSMEKLNIEINDDFNNFYRRNNTVNNHQGFSEISSTIHFTNFNSRDLANSKFNRYHCLNNQGYSIKSQSIVKEVLEELNNNENIDNKNFNNFNNNFNNNDNDISPKFGGVNNNNINNNNINGYFSGNNVNFGSYSNLRLNKNNINTPTNSNNRLFINNHNYVNNLFNSPSKIIISIFIIYRYCNS
jgi:hypothetical protein